MVEREVNLGKEAGKTMGETCGDKSKINGDRSKEEGMHKPATASVRDRHINPMLVVSQSKDLDGLIKTREECAERVWKFSFLLWRIASSQILYHHLVVLERSSWLQMPSIAERELRAEELGLFTGLSSGRHEDGAVPYQDWDVDADSARAKHDEEEDEDGQEDEGFEEEYGRIWNTFIRDEDFAIAFQSWIRLQINDWTALQTISSWGQSAANPSQGVKIHLLAMKEAGPARCKMEGWETALRNLATELPQLPNGLPALSSFSAQSAIDLLKRKIDEHASDPRKDSHGILKAFTPEPETPDQYNPTFYSTHHFGAVLASLAAGPEMVTINSAELQALIEVQS